MNDRSLLSSLADHLHHAGYRVLTGASGKDALELANQQPDLMILEVDSPGLSMAAAVQSLKQNPATASLWLLPVSAAADLKVDEANAWVKEAEGALTSLKEREKLLWQIELLLRARRKEPGIGRAALPAPINPHESHPGLNALAEEPGALAALIRQSEERFRHLAESMPQLVWMANSEGTVVYYNSRANQYQGLQQTAAGTWNWQPVVHPEDLSETMMSWQAALAEKRSYQVEHRIRMRDGAFRWHLSRACPVRQADGAIQWFGTSTDIDDIKHTQDAFRQSAQRQQMLSDALGHLLSTTDPQDIVRELFAKVAVHLGLDSYLNYLVHPEDEALHLHNYGGIEEAAVHQLERLEKGEGISGKVALSRQPIIATAIQDSPDENMAIVRRLGLQCYACFPLISGEQLLGTLAFGSRTRPQLDSSELDFLGLISNYTAVALDRVRTAQELTRSKEASDAANRAKSQFLASMSHELRTPMSAILGMTDLALNQPLPEMARDFLATVKDSANQLLDLLNEILDFSRIEAGRFELEHAPFHLPEVLDQVVKTLGVRAYEKGLELVYDLSDNLPRRVQGDAMRLRQVLTNLLGNAIKFTHRGEIILRAETEGEEDEKVRLRFSVSDTGIGISPEHLNKIFDPFTQADASTSRHYGGSGLGLAIAQRLVTLMGGSIGVQSQAGQGSTFYFTVVFSKCLAETEAACPVMESLRGRSVLVVASNAAQRRMLLQILSSWQMRPEEAADVPSGLTKIHQQAATGQGYAIILADAVMPTLNGFSLAEWLSRDAKLAGPVILMLAAADRHHYPEHCRHPNRICLDKPITHSSLLKAVARALGYEKESERSIEAGVLSEPSSPAPPRPLRLLLAEDTPANQKLVLHVLGNRGHQVRTAQTGLQALAHLEQEDFDLILMDVQMPQMDGFEATRKIRSLASPHKAQVPIIALTAHALKGDHEKCLEAGMNDYLSKPIQAQEMIELVERWAEATKASNRKSLTSTAASPVPLEPAASQSRPPLLNLEKAIHSCFGRYQLFKDMVACFFAEAEPFLQQTQAALTQKDSHAVAYLAHRLLNTVAYLGTEPLSNTLRNLERAGQSDDLPAAARILQQLSTEIKETKEALSSHHVEISKNSLHGPSLDGPEPLIEH